ncbi:UDP-N-acetylmuramate dehydrogenase [Sphingobacterium wenxiniae]|uniref:UDP-N-acetylenolpyruvoylglucosamine reductase n=1 Tax=Sphingobacterium wenxiniae TaxID=683125 RepID=A0A1I6PFS3_9SPHI|nr:UDP-N-acetylmuramate dehydrogenase [Sphingobacterium wenxiniae]SFS39003.1 UDP-N-acetylmuramate dehydrogenase [Sphingobacterium wenxiniae]
MTYHIQENVSLKPFNTFGVDAKANQFIKVEDENILKELHSAGLFERQFFVLGGGSNVLFTRDYEGLILQIATKGITHFIEGNYIYVTAKGGEVWNEFVWHCVERGFAGVENMALIPGTVGASPVQNIGAYGTELMDIFYSCQAFDTLTGEFTTFQNADCQFTYRDSIFKSQYKGQYIITSVTYKLAVNHRINTSYGAIESELKQRHINTPTIKDIAEVVSHIRVEKLPDPSTIGNAGSFFKNPIISEGQFQQLQQAFPDIVFYPMADQRVKLAAGWLIEQCGWKGKVDGNVAVWKNQALVLTNPGQANGSEIYSTSSKIVNDIQQKFGIELEREVNIL